MVHDAEHAREGRPVLALSRTDPASVAALAGWVRHRLEHFRSGDLVPVDPGPMASPCSPAPALRSARATCARSRWTGTRVALVPEQAVLLAGDHVTVTVRVGAGSSLEIVEPGGTVAYAMRGRSARWDVTVEVEAGGQPGLARRAVRRRRGCGRRAHADRRAGGRRVRRSCARPSSSGAPGRRRDGCGRGPTYAATAHPVLLEELDARVGMGPHRVLDQVLHLGSPCVDDEHSMVLESGDVLRRWLGAATHASPLRSSVLGQARSRPPRRAAGPGRRRGPCSAGASRPLRRRPAPPRPAAASSTARSRRRPGPPR